MIICMVPFMYLKDFNDVVDGYYYHYYELYAEVRKRIKKPIWLDVDYDGLLLNKFDPAFIVSKDLTVLARTTIPTVGVWDGSYSKKFALERLATYLALDRKCRYLKKLKDTSKYIYYGFKNLDELKTKPPYAIITSTPLRAALSGILLSERERRPKAMVEFTTTTSMTKAQIGLAKTNIILLKEAAGWK